MAQAMWIVGRNRLIEFDAECDRCCQDGYVSKHDGEFSRIEYAERVDGGIIIAGRDGQRERKKGGKAARQELVRHSCNIRKGENVRVGWNGKERGRDVRVQKQKERLAVLGEAVEFGHRHGKTGGAAVVDGWGPAREGAYPEIRYLPEFLDWMHRLIFDQNSKISSAAFERRSFAPWRSGGNDGQRNTANGLWYRPDLKFARDGRC